MAATEKGRLEVQVVDQRREWPVRLRGVVLHALAAAGLVQLSSWARPEVTQRYTSWWQTSPIVATTEHDNIYPDTDYPLRPANEPWDIATSFPYPRNLTTTVSSGTWLRIAVHPVRDEIVFDMLGDLYCMSTTATARNDTGTTTRRRARPFLRGVPFDKEAEFSRDGAALVFISDAGFGVDNIWTMPYTTCDAMAGLPHGAARRTAVQQTNATFRFFSSPAFHPTQPKIIATKWFLTGRPNGAGEIWEFPLLPSTSLLPERGGKRLVARKLPPSWHPDRYFESQLGSEQARYHPSGDAIIYSRNIRDDTTGKFSYNKDVHAGINAAFQLNTTTGATTELVGAAPSSPNKAASPGGANMPRLSHDGRTLAFVRRVDDREVLALRDMSSGNVRHAWDGLDYDLSTIPAFMGAYANYGWTAGDAAVIIWAQGSIWRVPLEVDAITGERRRRRRGPVEELAFTAEIDLALGETVYSETAIRDSHLSHTGEVRALRGLRSDDEGRSVVFEAAGDNFIADVSPPSDDPKSEPPPPPQQIAKPARATSCYAPSFVSGHPSYIVQACWTHEDFTHFVLVDLPAKKSGNNNNNDSGEVREITGVPRGRYVSVVSDGAFLACVRTGKDYMFGDVEETFGAGVWLGEMRMPSSSSASAATVSGLRLLEGVAASGETRLGFATIGNDGRVVLLVQNADSVVEYDVRDRTVRLLARGKTSVEMAVSSSQGRRSLGFRDFQHVWLSPSGLESSSPSVDRGMWSKPGDPQTPRDLIRLSEHGGHDVAFSGDGRRIFWLFGPTLHTAEVQSLAGACGRGRATAASRDSGECALGLVSHQHLEVTYQTAIGQQAALTGGQSFAIVNASLISMAPHAPRLQRNATIVVRNGEIVSAGPGSSSVPLPLDRCHVLDAGGGAVLPGLVDVHGHWGGFLSPFPLQSWEMETFLGYGVTTVHNPASRNVAGHAERLLVDKGRMYGPRVFHTGDVLYGSTQPSVYTEINAQQDARAALLRIRTEGGPAASFSAKNYQLVPRSARQRLLLAAAEQGMLVVPEGGWSLDWDLSYFIDGYTSLEHPLPVPQLYDDVLSLVAASGSSYTPLAVMNYGGLFGQHWVHQRVAGLPRDAKLRRYVRRDVLETLLTEVKQAPRSSYLFFNTTRSTAALAARGVRTSVGAHGEQPLGFLYHAEMRIMALGGQAPYAVLRHATLGGATSLGLQAALGSLEPGKLADLVVYPPGVDTVDKLWDASMHMRYVMRGGTLFAVEDGLEEVWPRRGRRQTRVRLDPDDEDS